MEWIVAGVVGALLLAVAVRWVLARAAAERALERGGSPAPAVTASKPVGKAPGGAPAAKTPEGTKPSAERQAMGRGLAKTRSEGFVAKLGGLFRGRQIDAQLLEEVEAVLYTADLGVATSERLLGAIREQLGRAELANPERVWGALRSEALRTLKASQGNASAGVRPVASPHVIMVVGVNGTGKTTTIGKIAAQLRQGGHRVLLVAGDTFRAAAADQLAVWAERAGAELWRGAEGSDPASVAFDGVKHAVQSGHTIAIVDTAGRLHTASNLVAELQKVHRVVSRALDGAPHEVWLVLDSTMGQNAIQQARIFLEAVSVSGLVLTKLDGTAKGGVVIGICAETKLPVRFIGVGEGIDDIRPFEPEAFVDALFEGSDGGQDGNGYTA